MRDPIFDTPRVRARIAGEIKYETGELCHRGHNSPRYVVSGMCVACNREANRGKQNTDKHREYQRQYYARRRRLKKDD